jgi:hypothetical protein
VTLSDGVIAWRRNIIPVRKFILLVAVVLCATQLCKSQDMQLEKTNDGQSAYLLKWDSVQDRMIAYRSVDDASLPSARIYDKDGHSRSIYSLRDLAESRNFNVWDAAAAPEGGMVLAGLVGYGSPIDHTKIKSVILTYSPAGDLIKFWEVLPYEFNLVAVDGQGDVYALGDADLLEPYPLLVKYSPEGKILRQFLSTNLFSIGDRIISTGGGTIGENLMFIKGEVLFVWFARTKELLRFSLSGELLSRVSLGPSLIQFAVANRRNEVVLRSLVAGEGNQMIAQVIMWDRQRLQPSAKPFMIQLSADGSPAVPLGLNLEKSHFLGRSSTGKLILVDPSTGIVKTY